MSQELNSKNVFEREIRLCEDFCYYEEKIDVKLSFNVSSERMTIWVYYKLLYIALLLQYFSQIYRKKA